LGRIYGGGKRELAHTGNQCGVTIANVTKIANLFREHLQLCVFR
jgi:hypothetical protein